jgi:hypothetical protein
MLKLYVKTTGHSLEHYMVYKLFTPWCAHEDAAGALFYQSLTSRQNACVNAAWNALKPIGL